MKRVVIVLIAVAAVAGMVAFTSHASGQTDGERAPIFGVKIPPGYRDWKLISVAHEEGSLNDFRALLGNDMAIDAYRESKQPFPDGTIIARLAWSYGPSEENNKAFGRAQSFVAGAPINVQFMVKDSKKYAATGGWGFAQFKDGKPAAEAVHKTCFACHQSVKARDFVFTRGPGEFYEIDATGGRIALVSMSDPPQVLKTPYIYLLIDRWSRYIPGIYVTLKKPSYEELRMALLVSFTSRGRFRGVATGGPVSQHHPTKWWATIQVAKLKRLTSVGCQRKRPAWPRDHYVP